MLCVMAEGLRVRHSTLRGPLIVAVRSLKETIANPTGAPWPGCTICGLKSPGHSGFKMRHIAIDSDGFGLVSSGVWAGLCTLDDRGGFMLENTISNPPRIELKLGAAADKAVVVHHKMTRPIVSLKEAG